VGRGRHGFRYLRNVIWDRQHGAWYSKLGRDGASLEGGSKHADSAAYEIPARGLVHAIYGTCPEDFPTRERPCGRWRRGAA